MCRALELNQPTWVVPLTLPLALGDIRPREEGPQQACESRELYSDGAQAFAGSVHGSEFYLAWLTEFRANRHLLPISGLSFSPFLQKSHFSFFPKESGAGSQERPTPSGGFPTVHNNRKATAFSL